MSKNLRKMHHAREGNEGFKYPQSVSKSGKETLTERY